MAAGPPPRRPLIMFYQKHTERSKPPSEQPGCRTFQSVIKPEQNVLQEDQECETRMENSHSPPDREQELLSGQAPVYTVTH
ncbi:hypothetical protein FQA47_006720 [Oryzias melastigma]|uniref:Uncharacterized protein n=1 Tax=Oryzias melastigma TaxID=30732 RepID=A0A834CUJ4_ORYME|nr:hypothetical protein FQA47_006720 [Oryzias melastigma]